MLIDCEPAIKYLILFSRCVEPCGKDLGFNINTRSFSSLIQLLYSPDFYSFSEVTESRPDLSMATSDAILDHVDAESGLIFRDIWVVRNFREYNSLGD